MRLREVDCIRSMNLIVSSDRCIGLSLLRTKDLCSFMVRVPSTKFICLRHAKKCRLNNAWITDALCSALSGSQLQFLSSRAHHSDATLQILIIGYYLHECSNIVIYHSNIEVASFVPRCLKPLVVHRLSKVIRRHLC